MNAPAKGSCLFGLGIVAASAALAGQPARAAERPLLVVVEAPPALDADAGEIRRAIGTELHVETVAPMKTAAEPPERALIVAIDQERIAMSLRTSEAGPVVRAIPAPADRAARLRAIAWLAGNLARDQVTPLLAEPPPEPPPVATRPPPLAVGESPPATAPASATEVPPPPPPGASVPPAATLARPAESPRPPGPLHWSVSGSIGPVFAVFNHATFEWVRSGVTPPTAWQISIERRRADRRLVIGAALQGTYSSVGDSLSGLGRPLLGADIFLGAEWRFRHCVLETALGAGPQAQSTFEAEGLYGNPFPYGSVDHIPITYRLGLFAQGTIATTIPISGALAALVQVGVNVNALGQEFWFAAGTLGLRYALQ